MKLCSAVDIYIKFTHFLHPILKFPAYHGETKFVVSSKEIKEINMENDDIPVGKILTRRDALKLLGVGSAAFLAACAALETTSTLVPTAVSTQGSSTTSTALDCVVRPELTIGPYFVDDQLNRSDIRSEPSDNSVREGFPLTLNLTVASVGDNSCTAIEGAQIDVWHCDALGQYSGVSDQGFDTSGQKFLRGYQLTDATGKAQFVTIYPGWYSGRAVHIHFTIRTKSADGGDYQFTSQFFFDDTLTDQIHALEPYAGKGQRDTLNTNDNIFNGGGDQLLLNLEGDPTNGYTSTFNVGLDLADTEVGASDSAGGPGGSGGPPPP
jgi:protocatechuate 3,4-dioxygenase beta subunit